MSEDDSRFSSAFRIPDAGRSETLLLPGPAGLIEAILAAPVEPHLPSGFAIVCHPHPLYGGALSNKVAYTLAACALKAGLFALRFNFRGVGKSGGTHDQGRGEMEDLLYLVRQMRRQMPQAALMLAGFSFGAHISVRAAAEARPAVLLSVAPPFGDKYVADAAPLASPACPWLVIHSRDDEVVAYEETAAALRGFNPEPTLATVDGAGHFFNGCLPLIGEHAMPFIEHNWPKT